MGLEPVSQSPLPHVKDADGALLAGREEHLVLGSVDNGGRTAVVAQPGCVTEYLTSDYLCNIKITIAYSFF